MLNPASKHYMAISTKYCPVSYPIAVGSIFESTKIEIPCQIESLLNEIQYYEEQQTISRSHLFQKPSQNMKWLLAHC